MSKLQDLEKLLAHLENATDRTDKSPFRQFCQSAPLDMQEVFSSGGSRMDGSGRATIGRGVREGEKQRKFHAHLETPTDRTGVFAVAASDSAWVKWRPSDPTSPHWYRPEHLGRLIAAYLSHDEDHRHDRLIREFVTEFRGLARTSKQKAVLDAMGAHRAHLSALRNDDGLIMAKVELLLRLMQAESAAVKPELLGVIGQAHLRSRMEANHCEMESLTYQKKTGVTDDLPWVIEVAFGCRKKEYSETSRRLVTGVNWSPGIINPFRQLGAYGESLDSILTQQRASRSEPIILVLHMACPRVEYTDRGKSAVVTK